jgi:hypothetical protein
MPNKVKIGEATREEALQTFAKSWHMRKGPGESLNPRRRRPLNRTHPDNWAGHRRPSPSRIDGDLHSSQRWWSLGSRRRISGPFPFVPTREVHARSSCGWALFSLRASPWLWTSASLRLVPNFVALASRNPSPVLLSASQGLLGHRRRLLCSLACPARSNLIRLLAWAN